MAIVTKRPQAEADLDEIFDYIAEDSPERAITLLWDLNRTMENKLVYIWAHRFPLY